MKHILSVSYDPQLAKMRADTLSEAGYKVATGIGSKTALELCQTGGFDLIILGQSVPAAEKKALIAEFRERCQAPALAILGAGESKDQTAAYHLDAHYSPEALIAMVRTIFAENRPITGK